ncbi:MAG: hypothetical protein AB7Q37_17680 [Pyrinomonadaceae bacterium]
MSKKYHVQKKEFLNMFPTWRAYIIASVEDTSEVSRCCSDHSEAAGHVHFELASCHDEIELHFSLATAEERDNSLYKANKLAEVIAAFRDAIEKEIAIINERHSTQQQARASSAVH